LSVSDNPNKPIASYIFWGTTGVGKTELAKALTNEIFGTDDKYIRFDMSEFQAKDDVVTFQDRVSEAIKHQQFGIVLFDEMEKAHKGIMDLFLQILEEVFLSDEYGDKANFRNAIIIFTTNLGAQFAKGRNTYKKTIRGDYDRKVLERQIDDELANYLRRELVNRIDNKALLNMLEKEDILDIARLQVDKKIRQLESGHKNVTVKIHPIDKTHTDDLYTYIARVGYNKDMGARPVERAIRDYFSTPAGIRLLKYSILENPYTMEVSIEGDAPGKNNSMIGSQYIKFKLYMNEEE